MRAAAVLLERQRKDVRRLGEDALDIAVVLIERDQDVARLVTVDGRRIGCGGRAAVGDGWQRPIVDVDELGGILGQIACLGYDDRDRLAHVAHLVLGQHEGRDAVGQPVVAKPERHPLRGQGGREIGEREDGMDARHSTRL